MSIKRKLALGCLLAGVVILAWRFATKVMITEAVLSPHATRLQVLKTALHPPYQMAAPHRRLFDGSNFSVVPEAKACTGGDCTGYETKPDCNSACSGFCGHCPDCVNGPCTVYLCAYTGALKSCSPAYNTAPCTTCRNDRNVICGRQQQ